MKAWGPALAAVLAAATAAVVVAQSLEEVAQKEKARRKHATGTRTFTNDDLSKPSPSPSPEAESDPKAGRAVRRRIYQPSAGAAAGSSTETTERRSTEGRRSEDGSEESAPSVGDPGAAAYWRGRAQALRDATAETRKTIATLEARVLQLRLDRDPNPSDQFDPNRLQKRGAELQKTLEDLDKARATVTQTQQQQQALEDEARLKGVPLSWVQ